MIKIKWAILITMLLLLALEYVAYKMHNWTIGIIINIMIILLNGILIAI